MLWTGRPKSAIREFERHIAMKKWPTERAQSMIFIGDGYGMLGQPDKQAASYNEAFYIDGGRREPLLKLARFYLHNKNYQSAICYAKAAMEIPWGSYYANQKTHYTNEPHEILYAAYGWMGNLDKAKEHIKKALEFQPENKTYLRDLRYYFDLPVISIVIPNLGREEELKKCLDAIKENANYPEDKYEVIVENDSFDDRQGAPRTLKRGVARSKGELVMFIGNDCVPQQDFLIQAVWKMIQTYDEQDGLIGLNDMYWKGEFATHWLASKKLLPYLGGEFFHTGYNHNCCDNELTERCKMINKYTWAELAKVYHDHPILGKAFTKGEDEVHKLVQNKDNLKADNALLDKRAKELGFKVPRNFIHPDIKLSVVIPVKNNIELTKACIDSILKNTPSLGEIIIVDDESTTDDYQSLKNVRYIKNKGEGVNAAWNTGINEANFPYICVCNNDILVTPGWAEPLINKLSNEIWMVSPFHTYGELPPSFPTGEERHNNMQGAKTGLPFLGSCFMLSKYSWSKIGPIDKRLKIWCGDNFLYEIITRTYGKQVMEISDSYIHHFGSKTVDKIKPNTTRQADVISFDNISKEYGWEGDKVGYPLVPREIDLRLRLPMQNLHEIKVINVGVGDMSSGLARQLPFLKFGQLDFVDIHKPYIDNAKKLEWRSPVSFIEDSLATFDFSGYDIVMVFDVFEHLEKEESTRIINEIKKLGTKLIVFGPLEEEFRKNTHEAESQDHLSLWTENDFKDLGFTTELLKNFHVVDGNAFDAIWAIM